jgi:hypothetical protein
MTNNKDFGQLAKDESINIAKEALEKNNISVLIVENGEVAKEKVLEIIPAGAEIMNMSSVTVDSIGLAKEILDSEKYDAVKNRFKTMDPKTQGLEMKKMGAAPDWTIGSIHAVTEDGKVIVASASGSQLPAYAYGSTHVIWVVGSQKIVKDLEEGMKRINEYVVPLENERALKAYGQNTSLNKILIFNKEGTPGRITMIIVKEKLGF